MTEHRFPSPPSAVAAVLGDPAFYRSLDLPDLRLLEVLAPGGGGPPAARGSPAGRPDGEVTVAMRYEFTGSLDPVARRLLGGQRLTWTQEVRVGPAGGSLSFAAENDPRALHGEAEFTLEAVGARAAATRRRLAGSLTVAVPVVGALAERRIVPGVVRRLDVEAAGVRRWLRASG